MKEAFEESFNKLNCEYIDLYLVHWPQASVDGKDSFMLLVVTILCYWDFIGRVLQPDEHPTIVDVWKEMEKLLETGKSQTWPSSYL